MRNEAPTTRARMSEQRDYWLKRTLVAERQLTEATKCVRALLTTRKAAEEWLRLFDKADRMTPRDHATSGGGRRER